MMTPEEMKAAAQLTLRQFYEAYYDKSELANSTKQKYEYELRCWERLTLNPPISEITNDTAAAFRQAMIDEGKSGETTNLYWTDLRCFLRIAAPESYHNPRGLGVIPRCPYMKAALEEHGRPRRIKLNDLGDVYRACRVAEIPKRSGPKPADMWKALIVMAYFTGLRKGDLLSLKHVQIDLEESQFWFRASKTRKTDAFPLHPIAVKHLKRIWTPRNELVFKGFAKHGMRFYGQWHKFADVSGINEPFGLHDIRRTACSEIERVKKGMAEVLLQHYRKDVTGLYYLNSEIELAESIIAMRFPDAFNDDPNDESPLPKRVVVAPAQQGVRQLDYWQFHPGGFGFQGRQFRLPGRFPKLLELLARAEGPLTWQQINECLCLKLPIEKGPGRIRQAIYELRIALRLQLSLPDQFDPVPCVHRGEGGAYVLESPIVISAAMNQQLEVAQ